MKLGLKVVALALGVTSLFDVAVVLAKEKLSDWESVKPSYWSGGTLRLSCDRFSEVDWFVSELDGRVVVEQGNFGTQPIPPPALEMQIAKLRAQGNDPKYRGISSIWPVALGWLVGFSSGEWGGALWVFSKDGQVRRQLHDGNIRFIFRWGEDLYAAGGLDHLGRSYGVALKLEGSTPSDLRVANKIDLPETVIAFGVIDEETLFTVSPDKLIEIRTSGWIRIRSLMRWWGPYRPNSVVRLPNGEIYVGARSGIAKFTPIENGFEEEWLVPAPCRK